MKMFQMIVRVLAVSAALSAPSVTQAALNAYMTIEGDIQGTIEGDVTLTGRQNMIEVVSVGYNVSAPIDTSTGLPTGKRQHRPVRILKSVDKSSPKLFFALTSNENLNPVVIRFWRPNNSGQEVHFYTIELIDARVVSISPSHSSVGSGAIEPVREAVSLVFGRIIITDEINGITVEDTWLSSGRI
jgi:type VI secretion system secreted protein Hcp